MPDEADAYVEAGWGKVGRMSLSGVFRTAVDDLVALAAPLAAKAGGRGRLIAVAEGDELALYEAQADGPPKRLPETARKRGGQPTELRLPVGQVLNRSLTLPAAGRDYLEPIIEHRLERLIPWSPDRALYGYRVAGDAEGGEIAVDLAATSRDIADVWLARASARGLEPTAIGSAAEPLDRPLELDLWRGARDTALIRARRMVAFAAIAAAVVVVPVLGLSLYASWSAETRLANIETRQNAARRTLAAAAGAGAGAKEAALIKAKRPDDAMSTLIDRLARTVPADTALRDLEIDDGRIRLAGSSAAAPALIARLEASGLMHDTRFAAPVTRAPDGRDLFEILAARVRPDGVKVESAGAPVAATPAREPGL